MVNFLCGASDISSEVLGVLFSSFHRLYLQSQCSAISRRAATYTAIDSPGARVLVPLHNARQLRIVMILDEFHDVRVRSGVQLVWLAYETTNKLVR